MRKFNNKFNLKFLTAAVSTAIVTSAFFGLSVDVSAADDVEVPVSNASQVSTAVYKVKRGVGLALQKKRESEEAKRVEEIRRAQEAQEAEEARKAQEAQAAEEARKAQETKKAEENRRAQEVSRANKNRKAQSANKSAGGPSPAAGNSSVGQAIVNAARSCIGFTYGANRGGISLDCSGLAQYSYRAAGIGIVHSAAGLYSSCTKVSNPQPGDLVFWASGGRVNHVEVYVGGGRAVGANLPGRPIGEHGLWSSGSQKIIGYGRFY